MQTVDLTQNPQYPSATGYSHYANLTNRGVEVYLNWMDTNSVPGGTNAITFVTSSSAPHMEIQTDGTPASILWHWGDGAITPNNLLAAHDFGVTDQFTNYVEVIPPGCVGYFGAEWSYPDQGIEGVFGAANFPNLNFLYLVSESLTGLSLAGCQQPRAIAPRGKPRLHESLRPVVH